MNNELKHYGVIGMKWGVRRARKYESKAARAKAKGDTEKASKYSAESKKLLKKHEGRSGKAAVKYTEKQSWGDAVVKSLVFGTYGTLKYNQARAVGKTRGSAAVRGVLGNIGNTLTYGVGSIVEPRISSVRRRYK